MPRPGETWKFHLARYDCSVYLDDGVELSSTTKLKSAEGGFFHRQATDSLSGDQKGLAAPSVPGNSVFGDLEAEFEKLTVNSRSSPGFIFLYHLPDERSNLGIDLWPAKVLWDGLVKDPGAA